ncbi:hypothetical protein EB796_003881 [Bugula neritina]|uniref:Uncharacterized protein n=1 Tax=Bugula neritina TaxID=10212 RepID=A0A7J7KHU5_BUGNE|nr:hypothetical protein EB796_003881 [Bugula neritina]
MAVFLCHLYTFAASFALDVCLILSWLRLSVGLFHLQVADGCFIMFLLDGLVLVGVLILLDLSYFQTEVNCILFYLKVSAGLFHLQVADGCFIIFLLDGLVLVGVL